MKLDEDYDFLFREAEKTFPHDRLGVLIKACQDFLKRLSEQNPPPMALDRNYGMPINPDPADWIRVGDYERMREELEA